MNDKELVVCGLEEARERTGVAAQAPVLAQRLREGGARAVCIVGAREGLDWIDTPHARGWLGGEPQPVPAIAARMREAMAHGFVAADAAILAKMAAPYDLPLLSWGEDLPPSGLAPSPAGGGQGWGRSAPKRIDLYAIVDSAARLREVLAAGVRTVQLRVKKPRWTDAAWTAMLRSEVEQAIATSTACKAELFINDHWELARELGAPGVHLGQEDLLAMGEEGRARVLASGMALGVSSHSLWELARARTLAPRYIACGPVWPTVTKDMPWFPQGMDNLAWWCRAAQAPVTAIGGILAPHEVQEVARTGCDGVCVVRGLGEDPRATVPVFTAALQAGRAQPAFEAPQWPHPSLPNAAATAN